MRSNDRRNETTTVSGRRTRPKGGQKVRQRSVFSDRGWIFVALAAAFFVIPGTATAQINNQGTGDIAGVVLVGRQTSEVAAPTGTATSD